MRVEVRLTPQKPDMASYTDNNNKNVKDITLIFTQANRLGAKPSDLVNGAAYGKCFKINAAFDVLVSPEAATATKPILLDLTNSPPGAAASPPARKPPGRMAGPPNLSVATPRHVARAFAPRSSATPSPTTTAPSSGGASPRRSNAPGPSDSEQRRGSRA